MASGIRELTISCTHIEALESRAPLGPVALGAALPMEVPSEPKSTSECADAQSA